ncbi:MAG: LytTR family transcriptional regulator [Marinicaulis sp.]|nr:LytTR family transcriptional regulator [Marinicaulis sp.]
MESSIWFVICALWIWGISLGSENGFGFFHQPYNSLVAPLIVGGVINAALFIANAFYAIPKFLAAGRWREYLGIIVAFFAGSVLLQTLTQKLIIMISEPSLTTLGWMTLAIDNTYMPPFVLILSTSYKFARDWIIHQNERRNFESHTNTLEQALRETREEMRILSSAGAPGNFLQINSGNEKFQIPINAIQYVKSAGNYVDIVTPERSYLAYGALKDFILKLPAARFTQIHRSFLIGFEHIRMIKGDTAYISNVEIPIGARYKKTFLEEWAARARTHAESANNFTENS